MKPVGVPAAAAEATPRPVHPRPTRWREIATWVISHLRPWLVTVFVLVIALTAWREFRTIDFHSLRASLRELSIPWVALAAALTVLNIAGMGLYDVVALGAADDPPRWLRWKIGCLSFTISNLVATGPLAGPALRLWLYRERGVSTRRIAQAIAGTVVGLWGGLVLWIVALAVVPRDYWWLAIPLAAALAVAIGETIGRIRLPQSLEEWAGAAQRWTELGLIGLADWLLATAVFISLLAAGRLPLGDLGHVALLFLLGHVTGLVTLVPGGLGSADAFWLWSLGTHRTSNALAAVILAYRLVYYLIPWVVSVTVLATEWTSERPAALKFVRTLAGVLTAACGYVVILSAATPSLLERLHFVARWLPITVLEASHLLSVLIGLGLVVLARGLRRGFREAMILATALLLLGALANVGKGGDWEEALIFLATAFLIVRHHRAFSREGRLWPLLDETAVANALALTSFFLLVGWWAHRDVPLADLWLRFESHAPGSRAVRGAAVLLAGSSIFALIAVLRSRLPAASAAEIDQALETILATDGVRSTALMVAAGDKLVWRFADRGLLLYGTTGNYLVVFGDPVVSPGEERVLLESFLDFAEAGGWEVVFYQISPRWIPYLHDQGFSLFKLGEEALVDVASFTLEGKRFKSLRNGLHHVERAGVRLRVIDAQEVSRRLVELRAVSDAWLAKKHVPEKRFSVGFFSEPFLRRFPAIVAENAEGPILGFASLMPGRRGGEASLDLMRYHPDAPQGVMDAIFVWALAWAREQGFERFSLGMAPLSTVGESSRAPLWERLSRFLYRHGAYFYNFQGLRQYKQKFQPIWEPRYMAYKPPWEWPQAMGAVAALIAGGWPRMVLPAKWINALSRALLIVALAAAPALGAAKQAANNRRPPVVLPAGVVQKTMQLPAVGNATVYVPADLSRVKRVVLFLSGDGGWELGVVDMALRLAPSAIVAGISLPSYQRASSTGSSCWYPAGELEAAAQHLEKSLGVAEYIHPTLVGYSSGASLVYAVLAQAPPSSFAGGVSIGFCPSVEISRSICGRDGWRPSAGKEEGRTVQKLPPVTRAIPPWKILHGTIDQVCSPTDVSSFVSQVPTAHLDMIDKVGHGFSVTSRWGARFDAAVAGLPTGAAHEEPTPVASTLSSLAALDLPLRVVPAEGTEKATLVFLSGDGGWADLDQSVAAALAKRGVTTIGWSTLRYFWKARSPDEVVAATERIAHAVSRGPVFVGGYSFGADVVGHLAPRLEPSARGLFLIGAGKYATFEVSPLDWIRTSSAASAYPVTSALAKTKLPWLCLASQGGLAESGCPERGSELQRRTVLPGGHHFAGDYDAVAKAAADWIDEVLKRT
jgi:phosphatidylglycerol lysyltransferase